MRRATMAFAAVLMVVVVSICALPISVTEVGIQFQVTHDPLQSEDGAKLALGAGGYCKLSVATDWIMRFELGSPLQAFAPQLGLALTYAVGPRTALEGQLTAQTAFDGFIHLAFYAGVRGILSGSATSRMMLSSFPLAVVAYGDTESGLSFATSFSVNASLDVARAFSEHLVLGQAIGISVIRFGPAMDAAMPLGEDYGLMWSAITHAGYRP